MPRIPLPDLDALTPEQLKVVQAIQATGGRKGRMPAPYQLSLANPELTDAWQRMGGLLRYGNSLPLRLSELAILITARHWNCAYEWYAHAPVALEAGLSPGIVEDLRGGWVPAACAPDEHAVFNYVVQLHERRTVSLEVHQAALAAFDVRGIVDLTAVVGYYVMVAMALNAHDYLPPVESRDLLPDLGGRSFQTKPGLENS